ncbi:UDP-Glycosyltransferase superfamily protein [Striga asiatica]|uniref:UDP-Glycosyltransferase superfamily protein n=1 Tax=Striga asiatica TaxID=4170 RepID=A0A5A7PRJ5_STRAF|nr:UDP-Glycosyltransferase superfamily protein [Striga asiatica]
MPPGRQDAANERRDATFNDLFQQIDYRFQQLDIRFMDWFADLSSGIENLYELCRGPPWCARGSSMRKWRSCSRRGAPSAISTTATRRCRLRGDHLRGGSLREWPTLPVETKLVVAHNNQDVRQQDCDQPFGGESVHARGVGPTPIRVEDFSLHKLVDAIICMLHPEVNQSAIELAKATKDDDGVILTRHEKYFQVIDHSGGVEFLSFMMPRGVWFGSRVLCCVGRLEWTVGDIQPLCLTGKNNRVLPRIRHHTPATGAHRLRGQSLPNWGRMV